ncbi:MAG: hypothetical protein DMG76_25835 [Acidobacteria bacterium]|nr:MAG: hypothetical protein DMD38_00110 [Gemmatimonadota bacterium]PYX53381.1 MAG: hypothetical protein DMG76_25835 [Acidobacteriota bacterium]
MSSPMLRKWERAEVERSVAEASHIDPVGLLADETEVRRYLDPPAGTCYPLEYAYHLLGDVRGKIVLDYGCGDGLNTLVLARRGATVKGLDISPDLIGIARQRLAVNDIRGDVELMVGSAHNLPLSDDSVDVVFGIAILHHLDLALSAREVRRVLRSGGRAILQEPVRNSKALKMLRRFIPYRGQDVSPFERPLTDQELADYASGFSSYRSRGFILPTTSVVSILPRLRERFLHSCLRWDAKVLRKFPALNYYAAVRVVELVK